MSKPRLLDLFCKEGGAAKGYADAGFEVVGVDIKPQPRYPFEFHQGDALEFFAAHWQEFDAYHGSPPCQAHSALARSNPHTYADFIPQTRQMFAATGRPWVIENVEGAPLVDPITLCGSMFGLGTDLYELRRHRLFESNIAMPQPTCRHSDKPVIGVYGGKARLRRRTPHWGTNLPKADGEQAMGIDWMTNAGLSEAIPPAYSEWTGGYLLAAIPSGQLTLDFEMAA
jgi:DNA (cytosine-5)-methyltransferase 1